MCIKLRIDEFKIATIKFWGQHHNDIFAVARHTSARGNAWAGLQLTSCTVSGRPVQCWLEVFTDP